MDRGTYIFHYTYGIEYTLTGQRQGVNQIGEWSLDKRHDMERRTRPKNLQKPPEGASDGAVWLLDAFNEAMPTYQRGRRQRRSAQLGGGASPETGEQIEPRKERTRHQMDVGGDSRHVV